MGATFFFTHKFTTVMLTAMTPVLAGLFVIAALFPAFIRLRLPGFEPDLKAGAADTSRGPTGTIILAGLRRHLVGSWPNLPTSEEVIASLVNGAAVGGR